MNENKKANGRNIKAINPRRASPSPVITSIIPYQKPLIRPITAAHIDSPIRTIVIRLVANKNIRHSARRAIYTRIILPITCVPVSCGGSGRDNVFFVGRMGKA